MPQIHVHLTTKEVQNLKVRSKAELLSVSALVRRELFLKKSPNITVPLQKPKDVSSFVPKVPAVKQSNGLPGPQWAAPVQHSDGKYPPQYLPDGSLSIYSGTPYTPQDWIDGDEEFRTHIERTLEEASVIPEEEEYELGTCADPDCPGIVMLNGPDAYQCPVCRAPSQM